MVKKVSKEEKLSILNTRYSGYFRLLTDAEVEKYRRILNEAGCDDEWFEPYAVREKTNDIVSTWDSSRDYSDFLFSRVYEK